MKRQNSLLCGLFVFVNTWFVYATPDSFTNFFEIKLFLSHYAKVIIEEIHGTKFYVRWKVMMLKKLPISIFDTAKLRVQL